MMLGIRKKPFQGKGKRIFITVDKFCLEGENVAGAMPAFENRNCDCVDGMIKTGVGLRYSQLNGKNVAVDFADGLRRVYLIDSGGKLDDEERAQTLFCLSKEGKLYRYDEETEQFVYQFDMPGDGQYCMAANANNEWYAIFTAGKGYYVVNGDDFTKYDNKGTITGICFCKGRIFLAEKHCRVKYSRVDSPWDFSETLDESGVISLAYDFGEIVALVPFHERVYVFMEHGVAQLNVTGSPLDFKIVPLDYSGGKIFGSTVGVCNNHIMFLTEDGVVRFNGTRFEMVAKNLRISPKRGIQVCGYAVCGDKYIVQYESIAAGNKAVVVKADGKGYFTGEREGLNQSNGKALCVVNGLVYEIVTDGIMAGSERYCFRGTWTDFGIKKKKTLRSIRLEGEGGYTLYVGCDNTWQNSTATFSNGRALISFNKSGKEFSFEFRLQQGAVIRKLTIELIVAE